MPLSQTPQWDVQTNPTDANHVRMKTVKEFFFIDGTEDASSGKNWTYTGQVCDRWKKNSYNLIYIWQIYNLCLWVIDTLQQKHDFEDYWV